MRNEYSNVISEGWNDDGFHEINRLLEKWQDRLTLNNLRLVDRYVDGRLELLVRLQSDALDKDWVLRCQRTSGVRVVKEDGELGALKCIPETGLEVRLHGGHHVPSYVYSSCPSGDSQEQAVFIGNVEVADLRQDFAFATDVRLYELQHFDRVGFPKALYASSHSVWERFGFIGHRPNGKVEMLHLADGLCFRACQAQGIGEMVQSTSDVVDNVAYEGCDLGINREVPLQVVEALSAFCIVCIGKGFWAGIAERLKHNVQVIDVLAGPFDFRPHAI